MTTAITSARASAIVFPPFRLDLRASELTRAGTPIPLRPKTWAVLVHLAERPGTLVTRDELLDAVWPGVAVTPDTLTKSIGELRLALGDDAAAPRFIATVHRRGFRFVAEVAAATSAAAPSPEPVRVDGGVPGPSPFVGREAELARLGALLAHAERGESQLVFVAGEAGIGKSALVARWLELTEAAPRERPLWVARGACIEQHGPREPYLPVLKALGRLVRRPDAAPLVALLRRAAPTWLAQMPWLVDDPGALATLVAAANADRMLREFRALVEALTTELTLVLVLEDLHWSDAATVDLLAVLAEGGEAGRLLVVGTHRPAELAVREHALLPAMRAMQLRQQCAVLPLHELDPDEVRRYLERRFPGAELPPRLPEDVHGYTDGTPLFVGAVADHLVARGVVLDTAPGWSFVRPVEVAELGVPEDARLMIDVLLAGSSPVDRELLAAASVVGVELTAQHVAGALGRSVERIEADCEELARAGRFLRFAGTGEWADGGPALRYVFAHELYRRAVYESVPAATRRRLHQRVGETLESAWGARSTEIGAELAGHFERSGDVARTVRYLTAAADSASRRFAGREAVGYLTAAIAAAARLGDPLAARREELALRLVLLPLLNSLEGSASAAMTANCERARTLSDEVGSPEQRFSVLYALAHVYVHRADPDGVAAVTEAIGQAAERVGSDDARLLADSVLARGACFGGRFREAIEVVENGPLAMGEPVATAATLTGADPVLGARWAYGLALWFTGRLGRADAVLRASVAAAEPGTPSFTSVAGRGHLAFYATLCRRRDEGARLAEEVHRLAVELGVPYWEAMAEAMGAWAGIPRSDGDATIARLESVLRRLVGNGGLVTTNVIRAFLAEAHLAAGSHDAGLAVVDEGLAIAERTAERMNLPELWRLRGELLLAACDQRFDDAERSLERAVEVACAVESRSLELRAALSLGRAWQARGRDDEARRLVADRCAWFDDEAESVDLAEARALLAGFGTAPVRQVSQARRVRRPA